MRTNPIFLADGYKPSHALAYPPKMTYMQSYLEARVPETQPILVYGPQYYIKEYLSKAIQPHDIEEADAYFKKYFGRGDVFKKDLFEYIVKRHRGYWPIRVYALPEGTVAKGGDPLMVIESTDPKVPWATNYVETLLSNVWYPTTVATYTYQMRQVSKKYLEETSDTSKEPWILNTRIHDFGQRGVPDPIVAGLGGSAALINSWGTDTLIAHQFIKNYYPDNNSSEILDVSIPATEHSTITSWNDELAAINHWLDLHPTGVIACVMDSNDINHAIRQYLGIVLKDKILKRDGVLVIRPDSGDPVMSTLKVFEALWEVFGGTVNSKGYRVLNPKVRMIQGDGIDAIMHEKILRNFKLHLISAENIAFGSGGGLLQKHNRDTYKFAIKCCEVRIGDTVQSVQKSPKEWNAKGDYIQSFKKSKAGSQITSDMRLIFDTGKLLKQYTFEEIRRRSGFYGT